jgi:hypothetical protein
MHQHIIDTQRFKMYDRHKLIMVFVYLKVNMLCILKNLHDISKRQRIKGRVLVK